jgi:fatty acid desaturase
MSSSNGATTPTQSTFFPKPAPRVSFSPEHKSFWSTNQAHIVALFSFLLGIAFAGSLAFAWYFSWTPQAWIYITFLSLFHFLEYFITAKYKPDVVTIDGTFSPMRI